MLNELIAHNKEIRFYVNGRDYTFKSSSINDSHIIAIGDMESIDDDIPAVNSEVVLKVMELFNMAGFSKIKFKYLFVPELHGFLMVVSGENPAGYIKTAVVAPLTEHGEKRDGNEEMS